MNFIPATGLTEQIINPMPTRTKTMDDVSIIDLTPYNIVDSGVCLLENFDELSSFFGLVS